MKLTIWIFLTIGGAIGGWLGGMMDHGNLLGLWSILLGAVGSIIGIWVGFKINQNYF